MGNLRGWKVDNDKNVTGTYAADTVPGQVVRQSSGTIAICGDGETPDGVCFRNVDVSENAVDDYMTSGTAQSIAAVAVTDLNVYIKPAASGAIQPCDTDKDAYIGKPLNTGGIGDIIAYQVERGFYAA